MAGFDLPYIDLTPYLNVALLAVDVFEWLGVIPDPLALIFSLFQGRPREEATAQVSARLIQSRNPAARLWGVALQRLLKEFDIVISSSGAGDQAILSLYYNQFVQSMIAQGVDPQRAKQIGLNAYSREAQAGAPLETELTQPLPQGMTFNGPPEVGTTFQAGIDAGELRGLKGQPLLKFAERYVWRHQPLKSLYKITVGIPTTPDPNFPVIPDQSGNCPPGYSLDTRSGLCWLAPPPGSGSGGGGDNGWPPADPPLPPQPDPDGDELTDCCNTTALYLYYLAKGIKGLTPVDNSDCCEELVTAIGGIAAALNDFLSATPGAGGGANVDLAPVVDAIASLTDAVGGLAPSGAAVDLGGVEAKLEAIREAIADGDKAIADALGGPPTLPPDPREKVRAFARYLAQNYAFDAGEAQIIEE